MRIRWLFSVTEFNKPITLPILAKSLDVDGLWPTSKGCLYWLRTITTIIFVNIVFFGNIIYTIHNWGDIRKVSASIASIVTGIHVIPKKIYMLMRRKKYQELFERFASEIWISPEEDRNLGDFENEMLLVNMLSASLLGCGILFDFIPLISTWNDDYSSMEFPFQISYTFNVKQAYLYECFYVICVFTATSAVAIMVGHDTIFNYFLIHTTRRIKDLSSDVFVLADNPTMTKIQLSNGLNEVMNRHIQILEYVAELENYHSFNIFLQFITTAFLICIQCVELTYVDLTLADIVKMVLYLSSVFGQLFVNSYAGEKLTDAGLTFGQAVYNSDWVAEHFDLDLRKNVILMIQIGQTPLYLTGMKFFNLSLDVFFKICKTAVSYFALIKSFIEEDS